MTTTVAQIESALKIVDRGAEAGDRWLFLASLAFIIIGACAVIRWLVLALAKKDTEHITALEKKDLDASKERKELHEIIITERIESRANRENERRDYLQSIAAAVERIHTLSGHLQANTALLTVHHTEMKAAHAVETGVMIGLEIERRERIKAAA